MSFPTIHKTLFATACVAILFCASCEKSYVVVNPVLPIEDYSYLIYDSVEGEANTYHYPISRIIRFQYDPNIDKCYMPQPTSVGSGIDTFDRSPLWKRGYVNRRDFHHRIIFNSDTITIHHNVENGSGEKGFRYTSGIKL